ncbi:MAG: preprotein translocase subunit YajC [Alphaproteobacteria bacterium]|nr:preprotein translocase subunit YajC [Alphaproteobacteria bacterium]
MPDSAATGQILLLVGMFAVFYFLLIRPQQKRMKEHRARISAMRRGDMVVTGGGVIGKVIKVESPEEALIEIADGVRVRVVSSTITDVRAKGEPITDSAGKAANDAS